MFWVRIEDFEAICFNVCVELFTYNQPIPPFVTRFPGALESSLVSPLLKTGGKDLYPEFEDKLAILFYFMIKNHPFLNGNKRMAVTTLLVTLYGNNKWIMASTNALYNLAVDVSQSPPREKEECTERIKKFIKKYMKDRSFFERLYDELIKKTQ